MNIGRVLKYLITGVVVGAVLFFAGFGVMNLLQKDSAEIVAVPDKPAITQDTTTDTTAVEVTPPSINVAEGTSSSPIKIKPLGETSEDESATAKADGEATTAEVEPAFGTLTLNAINATDQQPIKADFLIQNDEGSAIAQVKDTSTTTLSFPSGSYKITVNQGAKKVVRYLGVKDGQNGSETFELDVPVVDADTAVTVAPVGTPTTATASTGAQAVVIDEPVVTTPAATGTTKPTTVTRQAPATQTTTTTSNTETSSTTATVTTTPSATTPASSTQTTTAPTPATPSTSTAANESDETGVGGLRVSALTKVGKRPMSASFYIQRLNGENIANVKNVATHQFNLPAGTYRITARAGTTRMVKQIKVIASRGLHEIFEVPSVNDTTATAPTTAPVVNTPTPAAPVVTAPAKPAAAANETGRLELFARDNATNKPVRANFYIQTPQGKLVTSKTYVESIGYKLPTAPYKVTVRATGYKDKVTTLNVRKDQTRRETFKMELNAPAVAPTPAPVVKAPAPVAAPVQAVRQAPPAPVAANRGGLRVNVVSPQGVPLKADIMVLRRNGTPVKRAINASTANFDLAPRNFVVRVRHGGFVTNQQINIIAGKLAIKTITFNLNSGFQR